MFFLLSQKVLSPEVIAAVSPSYAAHNSITLVSLSITSTGPATGTPVLKDVCEARARADICALYELLGRLAPEKYRGRGDRRRGSHGCEDGAQVRGISSMRQN